MNNAGFYVFAVVAIFVAVMLLKHVVTCLVRTIIIIVLVMVLALSYYFLVGQYDPELHDAVVGAWQKYGGEE